MRGMRLLAALLLLQYVRSRSESTAITNAEGQQCSLFLAPSTIPNAGVGIFTAIPLDHGQVVGHYELMILIVDSDLYMGNKFVEWMISDYIWTGESMGLGHLSVREKGVKGWGLGLDAAINCNMALNNVEDNLPHWDDVGFHRSNNPGAGAFSPFVSASTLASASIPAGGELFKNYGDNCFLTREDDYGLIPLSADYKRANQLLQRFHSLFLESKSLSEGIKHAMYDLLTTFPIEGRVLSALPVFDTVAEAVANGIESLHQPHAMRSIQELKSVGRCLDNIRPGLSTLPEAGRGAFATRRLPAGSVISGSPLVHIPYDEMLHMYDFAWNEEKGDYDVNRTQVSGYQLLLNYCWGHAESTVLLCPYSAGVSFINHNQSLVNVGVRWAPDGQISHNATWLQQTLVADMEDVYSASVAMDFVALRDIEPGEELFLDYGAEWEDAWWKHVEMWKQRRKAVESDALYVSASQYNQQYRTAIIQTAKEQERYPYPSHLQLRCHKDLMGCVGVAAEQCFHSKVEWNLAEEGVECSVEERSPGSDGFVYKVAWRDSQDVARNASGVTRDFFAFFDRPYSIDVHLPWAFRHKMAIPDGMLPQLWKNKQR